jgi:multisubunit Na+/H+ antiporter MnhB subunit
MEGGPGLVTSGVVLVIALAFGVIANLQTRRPYERRIHGVPWVAVQFIAVVIAAILIMHVAGLVTGHEFTGRAPY